MTIRWLLNNILNGYIYSTLIVLICSYFQQNKISKIEQYFDKANFSILFILFLNLIYVFIQTPFFISSYKTFTIEEFQAKTLITNFYNYTHLLMTITLGFLFHLVFLKIKNRKSLHYTLISILLLFILIHIGNIVVFSVRITDNFSSAIAQYFFNLNNLFYISIFSVLFLVIHWSFIKKSKYE